MWVLLTAFWMGVSADISRLTIYGRSMEVDFIPATDEAMALVSEHFSDKADPWPGDHGPSPGGGRDGFGGGLVKEHGCLGSR